MPGVKDVAAYVLEQKGPMTTWKLQKLAYYSEAWHLVWEDQSLFGEPIEAWANGPVSPALYQEHAGRFEIDALEVGRSNQLGPEQKRCVDIVLKDYGEMSGQWLSELAHMEEPWRAARRRAGCRPGDRCNEEIRRDEMQMYYTGLLER